MLRATQTLPSAFALCVALSCTPASARQQGPPKPIKIILIESGIPITKKYQVSNSCPVSPFGDLTYEKEVTHSGSEGPNKQDKSRGTQR